MLNNLRVLIPKQYHCASKGGHVLTEPKTPSLPPTRLIASGQLLLCKFDEKTATLLPFFNGAVPTAHAMADYVGFVHKGDTCFVYIIELTTGKPKGNQFLPTKQFVQYIEAAARRIYKFGPQFQYRYILVRKMPVPKGTTKPSKFFNANDEAFWPAGADLNLVIYSVL